MSQTPTQIAQELIQKIEARIDSVDMSPDRVSAGVVTYLGDGIAKIA
jgi:hypothetical protein